MAVTVFYANNNMQDIGVLKGFKLDMTVSMETGNNDFEVRTSIGGIEMDEGYYIYAEGSEYGGVIDSKRINTKDKTLYYSGRTWRGMLESKIIQPPTGQDYYKASGDLNVVLDTLIDDFGLSDLFYADSVMTGVEVTDYQFYRYTDVYSGIIRLLSNLDYKLVIEFDTSELKCKIGAVPVIDYGENQEVTSDLYDFDIKKVGGTVNHLIGLGAGELKDRIVIHKYADANGTISDTQTLFGKDEVVAIYDYGNAEDTTELEEKTIEQLQSLIGSDNIQITLNEIDADVGDKLTAYEENTEIEAIQYVQSKVVTIDDETINVQHSAKTVQISEHGEIRSSNDSPSMAKLDDVSLSSLSDGQILQYDSTNQKWKNESVNYIVEEGTYGSWYYRKWASGVAECWCRVTMTVTRWQAWGNVWEGTPYPAFTFPSGLFNAIPSVTATVSQDSSGGTMCEMGQVTQSGIGYIIPIRPISTSVSIPYQYFVHVRGLWKEFTPSV